MCWGLHVCLLKTGRVSAHQQLTLAHRDSSINRGLTVRMESDWDGRRTGAGGAEVWDQGVLGSWQGLLCPDQAEAPLGQAQECEQTDSQLAGVPAFGWGLLHPHPVRGMMPNGTHAKQATAQEGPRSWPCGLGSALGPWLGRLSCGCRTHTRAGLAERWLLPRPHSQRFSKPGPLSSCYVPAQAGPGQRELWCEMRPHRGMPPGTCRKCGKLAWEPTPAVVRTRGAGQLCLGQGPGGSLPSHPRASAHSRALPRPLPCWVKGRVSLPLGQLGRGLGVAFSSGWPAVRLGAMSLWQGLGAGRRGCCGMRQRWTLKGHPLEKPGPRVGGRPAHCAPEAPNSRSDRGAWRFMALSPA